MSRRPSDAQQKLIDQNKCPHCAASEVKMIEMTRRFIDMSCNTCSKCWTIYSNGVVELEL